LKIYKSNEEDEERSRRISEKVDLVLSQLLELRVSFLQTFIEAGIPLSKEQREALGGQ
jgi:hypothetical protein